MLKLFHPQRHISEELLRDRLKLARIYVEMTRVMFDLAFPGAGDGVGPDLETLLVLVCIFIGDAEGRATTPTKISTHSGLPRTSVYRRLDQLQKLHKIVKVGRNYRLVEDAVAIDGEGKLARLLRNFATK